MNTSEDHKYLHALYGVPGIGTEKLHLLMKSFSTAQKAWEAEVADLNAAGLSESLVQAVCDARKDNDLNKSWDELAEQDIKILTVTDEAYPEKLHETPSHPYLLYIRGNVDILSEPSVAMVGSRKYSPYGKQAAERLAHDLASSGAHVISGLALGIDAISHRGALSARSTGKTIAILGGGIDDASIAPRTHVGLAAQILADGGTLVSQYAPGTTPSKGTFPARNAIMAGIAHATLVIEAAENSGTLITAGLATAYKRPLFAVPGSIFAGESVGTHGLIAEDQAMIVRHAHDVLVSLDVDTDTERVRTDFVPANVDEAAIYEILTKHTDGLTIDKLIRLTTLEGANATQTLVMMEIDGVVTHLGGGTYALR